MNETSTLHPNIVWTGGATRNFPSHSSRPESSTYLHDQGNADNEFLGFGFTSQDFGPFDSGGQMWMWERGNI
jgi:hypothetical protein